MYTIKSSPNVRNLTASKFQNGVLSPAWTFSIDIQTKFNRSCKISCLSRIGLVKLGSLAVSWTLAQVKNKAGANYWNLYKVFRGEKYFTCKYFSTSGKFS